MSRVASASAGSMTPTSTFGSVGSGSLKGIFLAPIVARVAVVPGVPIVPTPTSFLPRVAGEDEGGGSNSWNDWSLWNDLLSRFHLRQISSHVTLHQLVLVIRRKTA